MQQCLASVYDCDLAADQYEVFVVDNRSVDASVEMVREYFPKVRLIVNDENLGFSAANNIAIRQAQGEFILLLNPDTVVEETTFSTCLKHLHEQEDVGAVGVKMIDGSGQFLPESKRGLPSVWNSFAKLVGLDALFPSAAIFNGYSLRHLSENKTHQVDVLCGAFMMLRKSVLDTVGLLDERFFMYAEDIDLSYRIREAGHTISYLHDAQIIHYKGESSKKGSLSYVRIFHEAMILYVQKHYQGVYGTVFVLALKMAIVARGTLTLVQYGLKKLLLPVVDFVVIVGLAMAIKVWWADWRYGDSSFFDKSPILWNIGAMAAIMVATLTLAMAYRTTTTWRRTTMATIVAAGIILACYGLLPESYRSSRAVVTFTAIGSILLVPAINGLLHKLLHSRLSRRVIVVGTPENASQIVDILVQKEDTQVVGNITPSVENRTVSVQHIREMINVLSATEVIFVRQDMTMQSVMHIMTTLGAAVTYKVAGDDMLAIVGSSSRNHQGEIYTVDISLRLSQKEYQGSKYAFDKVLALLAVILAPLAWVFHGLSKQYWVHIADTLGGEKTWVGYQAMSDRLPEIRPGVTAVHSGELSDLDYAKLYRLTYDILPFFRYLFNMKSAQKL